MEDKIEKIFSYFGNIKNEPFYTSCISQIIQIYEANPESLKFILYNLNHLIFSNSKDQRLRLKHRLICSSLISKLNKIYVHRVKEFVEDKSNFELENFQIDQTTYKTEERRKNEKWNQLNLLELIEKEDLLFSSNRDKGDVHVKNTQQQEKVFDLFLDMNHATMLNIQNAFRDVEIQNQYTDAAYASEKSKFTQKAQKINQKAKENMDSIEISISNPFNLMYEICLGNILNSEWELRHLAVLILKQLLLHSQFLGFNRKLKLNAQSSTQSKFETISLITKDLLREHILDAQHKKALVEEIIFNILKLLSLDRFADYQGDESLIIVRMVGAEILSICFKMMDGAQQLLMIKMLRKVLQKDSPFKQNTKFTWEVKHSFLFFLNVLIQSDKSFGKIICTNLQECFIKMLANDQVDEIILCICQIMEQFIGQPFFTTEKIDRTNRQIWAIVQSLDDLSVSAEHTLRLLLKLFPYFKLNEGACIDRLKKFFTSKISQVRLQLYHLIKCLYSKKKEITDPKIIEKNLVLLLQAALIEFEVEPFKQLGECMPDIIPYLIKSKNIRKIVQFINTCVTPCQYTEQIIVSKFLIPQENVSEYTSNEYLYIYEHENVHNPISAYTDKRIWKITMIIKELFRHGSEGLEELLKGIEKNNDKNHRGKILIFFLLNQIMPLHKKLKIFQDYKQQAMKFINIDFSEILDNQIIKYYIPQMQKQLKIILGNEEYKANPNNKQALEILTSMNDLFKKNDFSFKNGGEIAKKLSIIYSQDLNPFFLGDLEVILRIMNNVIKIQRELCKNIKILSVQYLIQYNSPNQVGNLNIIIRSIMQAIKEDNYEFISQSTAQAGLGLSLSLIKNKKVIYSKFNSNLFYNISTNYQPSQLKLQQHQNSLKLEGFYMGGICKYISLIGKVLPDYLKQSWKYFLVENMDKKQPTKQLSPTHIYQQYNRLLTLLSGTITNLLKIDKTPLDQSQLFIHKFTKKISEIISKSEGSALAETIKTKTKKILKDSFIYLSENYSEISNIFFEWYMNEIQRQNVLFLQVLEKVSQENIVQIAPVASLFILQIVKSITIMKLHEAAMNSLSNLIVGVYTNTKKNYHSPRLTKISQEGIEFIKNFKNTTNFQYKIDLKLADGIQLRSYQIEGISWLGFLVKYNLSGALCDDMGLGKTLQTLVVLQNEYKISISKCSEEDYLHSLIICPSTLIQHWAFEYNKYFEDPSCQICLIDHKKKIIDIQKKLKVKKPHLFITSYSIVQKNEAMFENLAFKFIILDEGHLIKNTKTLKFKAIKKLKGLHRFMLTGTPIQNRLIELWGLFDFLMPGYLYTEQVFKKNYEKLFEVNLTTFKQDELLFSDEQRKTLEKLHFKVMPFIMRRMKNDVLRQLPQKIINDHHCSLTDSQIKHYENLQEKIKIQSELKQLHALANLNEMIKIVNHPYLCDLEGKFDWQDSGKFIALAQLFDQFGFVDEDTLLHNKVIIFAKEKNTLDLIERFLKENYNYIKYSKLTSDVREGDRFTVAQTFNGDSDIKILLVTKAIGGVGLNLSSANYVIMFDHDYNPTVDMQAIDRAHRIGQKRILNVFRLITKDTLQQKIMGIQKFKTNLANAIVNMDNASIKNIKESKLPDLLQNIRDLQKSSKEVDNIIDKTMYGSIVAQMQKNAIDTNEFLKKY